mmetsp:Transcript_17358/g.40478  ORF Transcript_17358/g.40478 Transcript_17358/m.40478 type:complete len:256 (-) Transcript_17358:61-828(-)
MANFLRGACFIALLGAVASRHAVKDSPAFGSARSTMLTIDVDKSGTASRKEVIGFATGQGLTYQEAEDEFKDLDRDGDGQLSITELESAVAPENVEPQEAAHADSAAAIIAAPDSGATVTAMSEAEELEHASVDAQRQANDAVAAKFAASVSSIVANLKKHEKEAANFEEEAHNLRGNAQSLLSSVASEVHTAARTATEEILLKTAAEVKKLHKEADKAEEEATTLREEADKAMIEARDAQDSMSTAVTEAQDAY